MNRSIRVVELFAGVGGFRLGLENASERYETIWVNQWEPAKKDQYAFDRYTAHFGQHPNHVCKDIAKIKNEIPDHDLLVGGFPCQDYSILKKNSQGIEGTKGVLWWQIDSILQDKHPNYVVLENVDRIIRSPANQPGRDFSIILRCFYEKGYAVEWRVINAADYGFPQRRRRTFIIAYLNKTTRFMNLAERVCNFGLKSMHHYLMNESVLAKAFPISNHRKEFVESWIDEMEYSGISDLSANQDVILFNTGLMMNGRIYSVDTQPASSKPAPLKDFLENTDVDSHFFLNQSDLARWTYAKGAKNEKRKRRDGSEYWFKEGSVEFPDSLDKPARTLITSEAQIGRTSHVVTDLKTGSLRTLTPVECERLNGFPDGWTDTGMPKKMRYFCMGNALVVPIVTRIGHSLLHDFTEM